MIAIIKIITLAAALGVLILACVASFMADAFLGFTVLLLTIFFIGALIWAAFG